MIGVLVAVDVALSAALALALIDGYRKSKLIGKLFDRQMGIAPKSVQKTRIVSPYIKQAGGDEREPD